MFMGTRIVVNDDWVATNPVILITEVADGNVYGKYFLFYKTGELYLEGGWLNGVPHGKVQTYYESGRSMHEFYFKQDVLNGSFKGWDETGKLVFRGEYVNGRCICWQEFSKDEPSC